jgi:hypothetical protein
MSLFDDFDGGVHSFLPLENFALPWEWVVEGKIEGKKYDRGWRNIGRQAQTIPTFDSTSVQSVDATSSL